MHNFDVLYYFDVFYKVVVCAFGCTQCWHYSRQENTEFLVQCRPLKYPKWHAHIMETYIGLHDCEDSFTME